MAKSVALKGLFTQAYEARREMERLAASDGIVLSRTLRGRLANDRVAVATIDPETIGLVLEGLDLLFGIFGEDETPEAILQELESIGLWMEEIDAQLEYMNHLLEEIRDLLIELQVRITDGFRRDAEAEVRAVVKAYAALVPSYREAGASPMLLAKLDAIHSELLTRSRKLMEYGYASVATVFYGFRTEIDLARILGLGRSAERAVARQYQGYFEAALDPAVRGSLVQEGSIRRQLLDEWRAKMTPGDKGFVGPAWWFKDNPYRECLDGERGRHCWTEWERSRIHPGWRVTGSIDAGFDVEVMEIGHLYADSSRPDGEYHHGKAAAMGEALRHARAHHLPPYAEASRKFSQVEREGHALGELAAMCDRFARIARAVAE
ncbi:MAG TPA: hypothetical protein VEA99_16285 [Gemmatimonadaceae bacterium]|nr:hypothetical protein [Gemmatimonadaceae bacterium]